MILADTSVWVDHLRWSDPPLVRALEDGEVCVHPFVIGELACGSLRNRRDVVALLEKLPAATVASDREAMSFLEAHRLMGRGVGWIDVHLLAATALTQGTLLWTRDTRLAKVARVLGLVRAPQ